MGYSSDLTIDDFAQIAEFLPQRSLMGRPPRDYREILNAIFYVVKTGCQWRLLPNDFPPWQTVYGYFRKWQTTSLWARIHECLRHKLRGRMGKDPHASVGIIDSQSVKTVLKGGTKASMAVRK